jgi:hypothetical protein
MGSDICWGRKEAQAIPGVSAPRCPVDDIESTGRAQFDRFTVALFTIALHPFITASLPKTPATRGSRRHA